MPLSTEVGQLREQLTHWQAELSSPELRPTLMVGIVTKSLLAFEGVLKHTVIAILEILDDTGKANCNRLLGGKAISGCSLGDKCNLLSGLKPDVQKALQKMGLEGSEKILSAEDLDVLHSLVRYRNQIGHGKMGFNLNLESNVAEAISKNIILFCDSALVRVAMSFSS